MKSNATTTPPRPSSPEALATLEAEVQRRRKAAEIRPTLAGVEKAEAPADFSGFLERSRARYESTKARFAEGIAEEVPQPCPHHPAHLLTVDEERTLAASREADALRFVFVPCPACQAADRARRRWERAGIPERLVEATLENYQTRTEEQVKGHRKAFRFVGDPLTPFLLLLGTPGTGKSHLAAGCLKKISPDGDAEWLTHATLLTRLRDLYGTGKVETFLEGLVAAPVLVLDEYGVSAGGKDEAPVLYQIFSARHDKRRKTILTSNEEPEAVKEALGFRLYDRIREGRVVATFNGPSYRQPAPRPVEQ